MLGNEPASGCPQFGYTTMLSYMTMMFLTDHPMKMSSNETLPDTQMKR